jgi:hypothetical protein
MDYQKMWYVMKDRLMKEGERIGLQPDYRKAADDHLKLMSEIEIKAMAESQRVCECGGCCSDGEPEPPKGRQAKPDSETTADKYGDTEKKPEGSDILKRIFGDDFVSDAETLKKKIREGKGPVIMADGNLEIPESLEKEAREKKIAIAHAHCGEISMGKVVGNMPFPFPFPPGFLK